MPRSVIDSQDQKRLRFITSHGPPNPKRRRINAACHTCRGRKIACSGEQPTCSTCKQSRIDCAGYSRVEADGHGEKSSSYGSVSRVVEKGGRHVVPTSPQARDNARGLSVPVMNDGTVASDGREGLLSGSRNRMPYFRWLGPTAIMPGYKQMVVKLQRHETAASSTGGEDSHTSPSLSQAIPNAPQRYESTPTAADSDRMTAAALPFYDNSALPPSHVITHLCETFFTHLGCNFPFLQKDRFMKDLVEKQVDAILVDAVCAMAARFSTDHLLVAQSADEARLTPSEYGRAFARRAKIALIDTYAVPSVAAVQAALLLAYNEFGESRDSGLWIYLGICIRLAQDLGLQKLQGLRYEGRDGPTPKSIKRTLHEQDPDAMHSPRDGVDGGSPSSDIKAFDESKAVQEQRAVERERIDTFWAVFFLDRVVSSGTGRRSTLRDNDIEISFPSLERPLSEGWPSPFPALIRIVHLYGRVADLLNGIKEPSDINSETPQRLAGMEARVTEFYQGLSPRLHFEAMNFHHYVKAGEGTNFVLLHFWFHTLIILLHQPTLLKTFEGRMLQPFPNSQQLAMSSAKTIADILSYSQLIDAKATLGNPFTTQPIYIAACAFLKETAERTASSAHQSRAQSRRGSEVVNETLATTSPDVDIPPVNQSDRSSEPPIVESSRNASFANESKQAGTSKAKHTLLAAAASQHYQLCSRALESLETYWAGTKYILTVLNQKFKGVGDPLLYTAEEGERSLEQPRPEPAFTSPGWRRKSTYTLPSVVDRESLAKVESGGQGQRPSKTDHSQAIGWTLTGTLDSPSTNLAWHYPSNSGRSQHDETIADQHRPERATHRSKHGLSSTSAHLDMASTKSQSKGPANTSPSAIIQQPGPFHTLLRNPDSRDQSHQIYGPLTGGGAYAAQYIGNLDQQQLSYSHIYGFPNTFQSSMFDGDGAAPFGDMLIESQDIDTALLGMDLLPWLDASQEPFPVYADTGQTAVGMDASLMRGRM